MQPILPGLTLEPPLYSESSNPRHTIPNTHSALHTQDTPTKRSKRKRCTLELDPLLNESRPSKRVNTKRKQSKQKKKEDIDTKRHEDEEDALLWSHFDDWDWDAILPLIP